MKKYEGFVILTKKEFNEKLEKCNFYPKGTPYKEGDVCWADDGKMYMSMKNGNRKHPRGPMNDE